jgi:hypothetical protein
MFIRRAIQQCEVIAIRVPNENTKLLVMQEFKMNGVLERPQRDALH